MAEYVRVTDPVSKAHVTVTKERAEALKLTALKEPAVDRRGYPLPATPPTTTTQTTAAKAEDKK